MSMLLFLRLIRLLAGLLHLIYCLCTAWFDKYLVIVVVTAVVVDVVVVVVDDVVVVVVDDVMKTKQRPGDNPLKEISSLKFFNKS